MLRRFFFFTILLLSACATQVETSDPTTEVDEVSQQKKNARAAQINIQLGLGYLKQNDVQKFVA